MKRLTKVILTLMLALPLISCGGGDPCDNPDEPQPAPQSRLVSVSGSMAITDDETFGSNEHNTVSYSNTVTVSANQASQLLIAEGCAGDEVRVRVELTASLAPVGGAILVNGTVKLFEGTSCTTSDLDGSQTVNFTVNAGQTVTQNIHVQNDDEGGDFVDVVLTVSNF